MVTAQGQNMERMQKTSLKNNVQKINFNAETVNLRINKYLNAKLLKFNMIYIRGSLHH